jgi:hypothetical protein
MIKSTTTTAYPRINRYYQEELVYTILNSLKNTKAYLRTEIQTNVQIGTEVSYQRTEASEFVRMPASLLWQYNTYLGSILPHTVRAARQNQPGSLHVDRSKRQRQRLATCEVWRLHSVA